MITLIVTVVLLVIIYMFIKYKTGKSKTSDQRSSMEQLACSFGTMFRKNAREAARASRTPQIMKEEAMQEVDDALRALENSYKESRFQLKLVLKNLKETQLPKLKDDPGKLEGKARMAKKKWEESKSSEGGEIVKYKENAIRFLDMKKTATERIKQVEKTITKIEVALDTSEAKYDMDRTELQMVKADLECVVSIPQLQVQESLNKIKSIQNELTTRMNEETIRAEVNAEINNETPVSTEDLESEFNNL